MESAPIALIIIFGGIALMYVVLEGKFPPAPSGGGGAYSDAPSVIPQVSQSRNFQAAQMRFIHHGGYNATTNNFLQGA